MIENCVKYDTCLIRTQNSRLSIQFSKGMNQMCIIRHRTTPHDFGSVRSAQTNRKIWVKVPEADCTVQSCTLRRRQKRSEIYTNYKIYKRKCCSGIL